MARRIWSGRSPSYTETSSEKGSCIRRTGLPCWGDGHHDKASRHDRETKIVYVPHDRAPSLAWRVECPRSESCQEAGRDMEAALQELVRWSAVLSSAASPPRARPAVS